MARTAFPGIAVLTIACNQAPRPPVKAPPPARAPAAAVCPSSAPSASSAPVAKKKPPPPETIQPPDHWWTADTNDASQVAPLSVRMRPDQIVFVDKVAGVRILPAELVRAQRGRWEWRLSYGPYDECTLEESAWYGMLRCWKGAHVRTFALEWIQDQKVSDALELRVIEARKSNNAHPLPHALKPKTYAIEGVRVHFFYQANGSDGTRGTFDSEDAVKQGGWNAFLYTDAALVLVDVSGPDFTHAKGVLSVVATSKGRIWLRKSVSLSHYFGEGEDDAITVPFLLYGNGKWCSDLHITATLSARGRTTSRKVDVSLSCGE